jgi:hypothetical protein
MLEETAENQEFMDSKHFIEIERRLLSPAGSAAS